MAGVVACEQRRLERADRPPPGVAPGAGVPALAPARRCAASQLARPLVARHQERETRGVRGVAAPDERALVELAVLPRSERASRRRSGIQFIGLRCTRRCDDALPRTDVRHRPRPGLHAARRRRSSSSTPRSRGSATEPVRVADVGTGAGAIAITLALRAPRDRGVGERHVRPRARARLRRTPTARRARASRARRPARRAAARPRT